MPRHIDADKLIEKLRADYDREGTKADEMAIMGLADASVKYNHGQFCYLNAIERVKDTPTADVVPKSKIAEIFEEIENIAILNGYISVSDFYTDHPMLAELKKKYTEDEK